MTLESHIDERMKTNLYNVLRVNLAKYIIYNLGESIYTHHIVRILSIMKSCHINLINDEKMI